MEHHGIMQHKFVKHQQIVLKDNILIPREQ